MTPKLELTPAVARSRWLAPLLLAAVMTVLVSGACRAANSDDLAAAVTASPDTIAADAQPTCLFIVADGSSHGGLTSPASVDPRTLSIDATVFGIGRAEGAPGITPETDQFAALLAQFETACTIVTSSF